MINGLVSVIVPMYNCEKFVAATIESILAQTYKHVEILLIDDCSSDRSYEIAHDYSINYKNINVFRNDSNSGAGYSRNVGLKLARGQYCAFIDSDDIWDPSKLKVQIEVMRKSNCPISHTSYSIIDEADVKISGGVKATRLVGLSGYMKNTEIGMSTAVIDRSIVGPFSFSIARTRQDTLLWLDLLSKNFYSIGISENLVMYRVRRNQISSNKFKMMIRTFSVFMTVKSLPVYIRLFYFLNYAVNGILKRI